MSTTLEEQVNTLPHDDFTRLLTQQIVQGIQQIEEANKVLLESEAGTPLREIDSQLKSYSKANDNDVSELDPEIVKAVENMENKREAFKKAQNEARNLYRTNVLEEDAQEEPDVDKDALHQSRKMVMEAVNLIKSYGASNGKNEFVQWAQHLEIPQVGRKGSAILGQKKPRAWVSVDGETKDSFGEAVKYLVETENKNRDKDNQISLTAGDLTTAWIDANEPSEFEFMGHTIGVQEKPKKQS